MRAVEIDLERQCEAVTGCEYEYVQDCVQPSPADSPSEQVQYLSFCPMSERIPCSRSRRLSLRRQIRVET